jgi:hypothetical protein
LPGRRAVDSPVRRKLDDGVTTVERQTHRRGTALEAQAQERPTPDPAVALLVAVVSVLLALALGTALFLLLPAAF